MRRYERPEEAKFEARNPKLETNSNDQNINHRNGLNPHAPWDAAKHEIIPSFCFYFRIKFGTLRPLNFEFVSDFEFRISDLRIEARQVSESDSATFNLQPVTE